MPINKEEEKVQEAPKGDQVAESNQREEKPSTEKDR